MDSYLLVLNRLCEDVQKSMVNKPFNDEIEWDVSVEILLFYAMIGHKPVGVNRYYMMTCIHDKFSSYINKQMSSKPIWDHLDSMYDMGALHESEIIPFPNEEIDFELPVNEFGVLVKGKLGIDLPDPEPKVDSKVNLDKSGKRSGTIKSLKAKEQTVTKVGSNISSKATVTVKTEPSAEQNNTRVKQESHAQRTSSKIKVPTSPNIKAPKTDVSTPTKSQTNADNVGKKTPKQEPPTSTSRKVEKQEVIENDKKNRDLISSNAKKSKLSTPIPNNKRVSKSEMVTTKKKSDSENSGKKSNESSPNKQNQKQSFKKVQGSPQKYVRGDDTDSQSSVGSSKSSRAQGRNEQGDRKRQRQDLASPKGTPSKRRRN